MTNEDHIAICMHAVTMLAQQIEVMQKQIAALSQEVSPRDRVYTTEKTTGRNLFQPDGLGSIASQGGNAVPVHAHYVCRECAHPIIPTGRKGAPCKGCGAHGSAVLVNVDPATCANCATALHQKALERGRLGGAATKAKAGGSDFYREIGAKGAAKRWGK